MYERFTDRARKIMQLANQEAQRFNHEYLGTEHILLGLTKEGSGVAATTLIGLGLTLQGIRLEIEKIVTTGPGMITMGKLPQTPRAKKVIEYACQFASDYGFNYVGSEHLLIGLMLEGEGIACQVLTNLRIDVEGVKREMLQMLGRVKEDLPTAKTGIAEVPQRDGNATHPPLVGVGILRYPDTISDTMRSHLQAMTAIIRQGVTIGLPSTRDGNGNYVWDFTVVAGEFGQVKVERIEADEPTIVE